MTTFIKTSGYSNLSEMLRDNQDWSRDGVVEMLFGMAQAMYAYNGDILPGFGPSPMNTPAGGIDDLDPDEDRVACDVFVGIGDTWSEDDVFNVFIVFDRYFELAKLSGNFSDY